MLTLRKFWGISAGSDRVMPRSLTDGLRRLFGQRSGVGIQTQPLGPPPWRDMTRIGVVLAIEAGRPGADRATVFARRLGSPLTAFDYQMQFLPEGPVRFCFLAPPSPQVWKMMQYMDFEPEDGRKQVWVRKIVLGLVGERFGRRDQSVTSGNPPWPRYS